MTFEKNSNDLCYKTIAIVITVRLNYNKNGLKDRLSVVTIVILLDCNQIIFINDMKWITTIYSFNFIPNVAGRHQCLLTLALAPYSVLYGSGSSAEEAKRQVYINALHYIKLMTRKSISDKNAIDIQPSCDIPQ